MLQVTEIAVWGDHPEPYIVSHDPENTIGGPHFFIVDQCGHEFFFTLNDLKKIVQAVQHLKAEWDKKPQGHAAVDEGQAAQT